MKRKTLSQLEAEGYKIPKEDRDRIMAQQSRTEFNKALGLINESIGRIESAIGKIDISDSSIEPLLKVHFSLITRMFDKLKPQPEIKSLTFKRGKDNLITSAVIHRR